MKISTNKLHKQISGAILTGLLALTFLPMQATAQTASSGEKPPKYDEALNFYKQGKYDESLGVIRTVFTLEYKPYAMRMLAAANYEKLGKYANAMEHMIFCIKEHPAKREPRVMLVGLYRKTGKYKAALNLAYSGLKQFGENSDLRMELARVNYKLKRYTRARKHLDVILKGDGKNSEAFYLDGLIYLRNQNYENAELRFRHSLDLKPASKETLASIYFNLGVVLERQGDQAVRGGDTKGAGEYYRSAEKMYGFTLATNSTHQNATKNLARVKAK